MIVWSEQKRKLSELKPFEDNPRKITEADLEKLVNKIKTSGYHQRIRITHDNRIIGGHQRLKALKKCGYKEVAVLVPDEELTDEEYRREVIQDNLQDGSWDIEALAKWDIGQLNDWGLDTGSLGMGELPDVASENNYTTKVESPHYEIRGEKPKLSDIYDTEKTKTLISKINQSAVSQAEKDFLIESAKRHTVFNFGRIAEYYAHSDAEMQDLMEASALVIVDYDRAIADGYLALKDEMAAHYSDENGEENAE
jgi:hypothetical protein